MLTYAPTPSFKDLLGLPVSLSNENDLAAPWRKPEDHALFFSKSAWALACLGEAFSKGSSVQNEIWIPSYFCNQSLWPLRQTKIALRFYPVQENLEPDWDALTEMLKLHQPKLFLLTHYFGHQNNVLKARQFCDHVGALFIEDGAHVLRPFDQIGELADFAFYSLHKLLAIPDGSLLVIRPRAMEYEDILKTVQKEMGDQFQSSRSWLIKRLLQKFIPGFISRRREAKNSVNFADQPASSPMPKLPSSSPFALKLLGRLTGRINSIAQSRQKNESHFREVFKNLPDLKAWPLRSHPDRTPYYAVFSCGNSEIAQNYFEKFRKEGLIVQTWPDLAPEVLSFPETYNVAINIRSTLLTFPVHQSLSSKDIRQYNRILKQREMK